jgi:hypothetical protein
MKAGGGVGAEKEVRAVQLCGCGCEWWGEGAAAVGAHTAQAATI